MALSYSTAIAHRMLNSTANGGLGLAEALRGGVMDIYSGARPATADGAIPAGSVHLGRVTVNGGAWTEGNLTNGLTFAVAAGRSLSKAPSEVWMYTGLATGTPSWFRFRANAADPGGASTTHNRVDGTISPFGGDLVLGETSIVQGNAYVLGRLRFDWATA